MDNPIYLVFWKGIHVRQGLSSILEEDEEMSMTTLPLGLRENGCCLVEGNRVRAGNGRPGLGPCGLCLLCSDCLDLLQSAPPFPPLPMDPDVMP